MIDATGKYVLPGCIDPHTHLDMPFGGTVTIDDVESGQTSAAFGGTTCHVDFIIQPQGSTFADAIESGSAKAEGKQVIDMGYHMAVTDLKDGGTLEELATLPDQGITSYKLFMAYKGALMVDDETLFRTMQVAAETGALVMVHAENGDAIDVLVKEALAAGHTEPKYHALTRPPETEGEATNRAIQLARVAGSPLYVVHVSCRESVEPIARARDAGWNIHGETCTQYLFIDYTFLERPDFEGAKYVYTPPPRDEGEPGRALERRAHGRALGDLDRPLRVPLGRAEDARPRRLLEDPERRARDREPAAHDPRVRRARRAASRSNRMVELLATNPAKLFGLYPRKGTIAVGSDADIVVFDPEQRHTLSASTHHSKVGLQPLRGDRGDGRGRARPAARPGARRRRRARRASRLGQFVARARSAQS